MAGKLYSYLQLADDTTLQITGSYQKWTDFLSTADRLYKYVPGYTVPAVMRELLKPNRVCL